MDELTKLENEHKNNIKLAKKQNKKLQQYILSNKDSTVKGSTADKEDREALETFKVETSN